MASVAKTSDEHAVELEIDGHTVPITHPDKVFFATRGDTKLDLVMYYLRVGEAGRRARGKAEPQKPAEQSFTLEVTLAQAVSGATRRVKLPGGREVEITVPEGVSDGKVMRLRGLGQTDPYSGETGDVLMTIKVKPDPRFTVDGNDLRTRVAVPLAKAVLGGALHVPTLTGAVEMTIPPMTGTTKQFRLRGKGLKGEKGAVGDLFVAIDIEMPASDAELTALMKVRAD